jgi:hypothetical protein
MSLRIFADSAGFRKGARLCPLLIPWGEEFTGDAQFPFFKDAYARTGGTYFTRTGPAECELVVCPIAWQGEADNELVKRLAAQAKTCGKPLVVFCESDMEEPFPIPGACIFRGSMRRSLRLPVEMAAPAFIVDHLAGLESTASAQPRAKADSPVVGFCGYIDTAADSGFPLKRVLARAFYWGVLSRPGLEGPLRRWGLPLTRSVGKRVRYQALGEVSRCARLRRNILVRDHFLNGALLLPKEERAKHQARSFAEFRENVLGSDYTLCPRGGGNWSYRLYETLCLGRVPVFFNTDCVLPYEPLINWPDHCVWVEGDDMGQTARAILRHYERLTPEGFQDLQQRCRQLWLDYLSLDGFFRNFHRHAELHLTQS